MARMLPFDNVRLLRDSIVKQSKQLAAPSNPVFFGHKQQLPQMNINSNKFQHEKIQKHGGGSFNNWQVYQHNDNQIQESLQALQSQPQEDLTYGINHDPSEISDSESNDERKQENKRAYKEEIQNYLQGDIKAK